MKNILIPLILVLVSSFALAAPADEEDLLQKVLQQQHGLQADLDSGMITGLTTRQVNIVRKAQKEVFAVTESKSRLDQLSMEEKIRLENALERINAEVVNTGSGQDNRQMCWREAKVGTAVKSTRCGTVAEMRAAREGARDFMERPRVCGENCGSSP